MDFIVLSLAAAFLWAWVFLFDRILVSRHISDSLSLTVLKWSLTPFFLLFLPLLGIVSVPSFSLVAGALFAGMTFVAGDLLYFTGLGVKEDLPRASIVLNTVPLFVTFMAVVWLREVLTWGQYGGLALVVAGVWITSLKRLSALTEMEIDSLLGFMLGAAVLFAVSSVTVKYLLLNAEKWTVFFLAQIGAGTTMAGVLVGSPLRKRCFRYLKRPLHHRIPILLLSIGFDLLGVALAYGAMARGPVSVVSALTATHSFFVILLVGGLGALNLWTENRTTTPPLHHLKNLVATSLLILGIYLIN